MIDMHCSNYSGHEGVYEIKTAAMDNPIAAVFYFSVIGWCLDSHPFHLVSGYIDSKFLCVTNDTPNFSCILIPLTHHIILLWSLKRGCDPKGIYRQIARPWIETLAPQND